MSDISEIEKWERRAALAQDEKDGAQRKDRTCQMFGLTGTFAKQVGWFCVFIVLIFDLCSYSICSVFDKKKSSFD